MLEIKTKRLKLRPLEIEDAVVIVSLIGDFEVARQTASIPYPFSVEAARSWITAIPAGSEVVFGIEADGQLVGKIGFKPDKPGIAEISYWLGRDYWGTGYATEAARALLPVIFEDSSVETILAGHARDNPGSKRVIEKLGFTPVSDMIYFSLARGEDVTCLLYQLHRDEFLQRKVS